MPIDRSRLDRTLRAARRHLLAHRTADGHWAGQLASSALATATAVWALHLAKKVPGTSFALIQAGLDWLANHQNDDGGWGDTVRSNSNLSTTMLAWSALAASDGAS